RGRAATARSDQFGFAASLYFALSGQSVYATLDTTDAAPSPDPQRLAQGLHDLPARTRQALLRALRLEPHQRFESMEALLAELSARRPRWILPSVAAVGLTGSLAWLMLGDPAPCPGDDFEPWTAADVRALSQASGKDPSSARDVNDAIDGFGRDHARLYALRAAACEAARRDPTAEHLEQAACVERQWSAYREVRAALMGSAPPQSTTITTQIDALAPPDSCRRTSPDRSPTIPSHEEIGGPIEALIDDGRIDEALDAIDAHQDTATPSRRAILQRLRGTAYTFAGRDAAARNAFRRAMAQADSLPDDTVAATVLLGVARGTLLVDGDVEAATLLRERAHARMPLDTMGPALRRADDELAVFLALRAGRIGEVVERLSPLLDRADDELPHHSKTVVDFASLAAAATRQRSNDIAAAAAERCVEFPGERNVTALAAVADCRLTLARLASDQGDWTRVVDQVHAAFGLASTPRMGSVLTARIHHRGADLLARAGRHDAAVTAYERAIEDSKSEDGRHTRVSAASLADLGRVHERAGDLDLAETAMRQSAAVSAVLAPDTYDHALTMAMLGHVLSAKGEPEAAVVAYDQSLACKDAQHDERLSANIRLVRAIAVSAAGDTVDCPQVRADLALMPAEDSPDYVLVAALAERCADAED
ncbi:MAG: tetratricopeptide repeat protein, partial [Deltaproteobacteria bacterium]|nr:tetratricopeptide repeat protein [Deltaproteobacteria bacterium]